MAREKKIGLALSGGGAKGIAHIGVIQELGKLDIRISCVSGTSMGALVGAWFASGKDLNILLDIFQSNQWRKYFHFSEILDSIRTKGGFFSLEPLKDFLEKEFGSLKIENLEKKFCAVATSLKTGKKVEIKSGRISDAILASICLPVVFSPVQKEDDLLVDGGMVENFPVNACFEFGADAVIGCDVRYSPGYLHEEIKNASYPLQWKIFRILSYLMEIVNLKEERPESDELVIIKPYVSHISIFDFDRAREILKLGQEAFKAKENKIRRLLGLAPRTKDWWERLFEA